jgi:hypothetical protein
MVLFPGEWLSIELVVVLLVIALLATGILTPRGRLLWLRPRDYRRPGYQSSSFREA